MQTLVAWILADGYRTFVTKLSKESITQLIAELQEDETVTVIIAAGDHIMYWSWRRGDGPEHNEELRFRDDI